MSAIQKLNRAAAAGRAAIDNAGSETQQQALALVTDALTAVIRVVEDVRDDLEAAEVVEDRNHDEDWHRPHGW